MIKKWFIAFLITQAIEVPIYTKALSGRFLIAFGASLMTHPFVWFVFPRIDFLWNHYAFYFAVAEIFAFVTEALYLKFFGAQKPWLLSLLGNSLSAAAGFIVWNLDEWFPSVTLFKL